MRQSLKNLHDKNKNRPSENQPHSNDEGIIREEYTQLDCNDKTCASSHINSEYGMNHDQKHNRGNFIKHPSIKTKKVNEYDLLNPCYSDSQPLSKMPMNKNNSAIVICSNDEEDKSESISKLSTSRNNFKNGLSHKRDNTPKRNVSKLLHSNSSCRSVSNGRKMRSKKDQRSKISKKKMKLKNIMESDTVKNHYRKLKQPKFADIGMNLLTKKKGQINTNQNQNSELIELTNDISGIGKGKP